MPSITIVFRKDKLNKKGEAPVHFRIIKDRKIHYISSGIMLLEEHWDFDKIKIKSKHTNSHRLNSFLANKYAELQDQVFEHETVTKSLTSRMLRDKLYGKKPTDFFAFSQKANQEYLKDGKIGTYDKNKSILAKLTGYMQGQTLSFQDITPEFLSKYENHLKQVHKNSTNTVHKDFKFIRKLFNDAYREDIIEHSLIPFTKYKMKTTKTQRNYLDEDELKSIEDFNVTPGTRLELHRDMFVFAAYTGGLRVSDILQLRWKDYDGININFTIKKTGTQLSIKVPDKGNFILNKYKPKKSSKNTFIFPMLSNSLNINDPKELDNALSSATAYINKNLKIIADKLGLEKKVSFHISRHTWATRALRKGISIDKVSKIMGHAQLRETQIYAKIVNAELDKAMDVFND